MTCIVSHERNFDASQVIKAAQDVFQTVKALRYEPYRGIPRWPAPQNYAFKMACTYMARGAEKQPWLWWEQDAVPLTADAFEQLADGYAKCGKPFMGTHGATADAKQPVHLNGVAVYPENVLHYAPAICNSANIPFDVIGGKHVMGQSHISPLFQHVWSWDGPTGAPPSFLVPEDLRQVSPDAVMFHRCKDGSLIEQLRNASMPMVQVTDKRSFYHSGDLGDTIYSLATVKAMGGGAVYLGPDNRSGMRTRDTMTPSRANALIPLIRDQPYITACQYSPRNPGVAHDLNDFRLDLRGGSRKDCSPGFNLARVVLDHWHLPLELDQDPWLSVSSPNKIAPVVFARSERYRVPGFNWQMIADAFRKEAVFIGTVKEHTDFCRLFGTIPHFKTDDLLEAARVIAGCDLFVGNQSCPYAIAIGLGKSNILEHNEKTPNCIFDRPNVRLGTDGLKVSDLTLAPGKLPLLITSPLENFTGYGQLVCQLCTGLIARNYGIHVNPFSMDENRVPLAKDIKDRIFRHPKDRPPGLLICAILEVPMRLRPGDVLLTMWESTRLSVEMVDAINKNASCVIVPTHWGASCFSASGVTVPIRVATLGVDSKVYHLTKPHRDRVFRFGTAGRLAHAGVRKGVEETVETFLRTFPIEQDVELHVKIFEDCKLEGVQDPRVIYYRKYLSQADMVAWYERLNVFVSLTKGEGWGLHIHQAMAMGRPCIVPRASGQSEFVTEDNALCVRFKWQDPEWSVYKGYGQWCIADHGHCSELMRHAYEHRIDCEQMGQEISRLIEFHRVRWHWVQGHADNEMNNRCDALAEAARKGA